MPGQSLTVACGYNALGLVSSLTEGGKATAFACGPNHRRTGATYPGGVGLSQGYDASGRLSSIAGTSGGAARSGFGHGDAKPGGGDGMLPTSYAETLAAPNGGPTTRANGAMTYDALNRLAKWLATEQADGGVVHDYTYQYDGVGNRTQVIADPLNSAGQIVADPSQGTPHSNESDLSFNAPNEIAQVQPYGTQGQALTPVAYGYDAAGNQTGNNGGGTGKPLTIAYLPTNQTQSISDLNQNAETMTWAGAGQAERVKRTWTDSGTSYAATYTWSLLGLSGYSNTGIAEPKNTTSVVSWIVRDPSGTPIAQRYSNGQEYYYLFDGQGDMVGLEDPGSMQAAYDFCPTGNEADLASTILTAVALANPLRQYAAVYDDLTKDYFGSDGLISEDYNGTATQAPELLAEEVTGGGGGSGGLPPLPPVGSREVFYVDPFSVRFSQNSISFYFANGGNIDFTAQALQNGDISTEDFPPIRLVQKGGYLITIGNRRLETFRLADLPIRARWATNREIRTAMRMGKFSAGPFGSNTIYVRGAPPEV